MNVRLFSSRRALPCLLLLVYDRGHMKEFEHFHQKLEEEKTRLEGELKKMARPNPDVKGDWEPTSPDMNPMVSDANEMADTFEEMDNMVGIEYQLEERLKEVAAALERIEKGIYGTCEKGGEKMDMKRLEANPAARTCVEHSE
ncbi:MAG: hypothetical protein COU47_02525 [Candidatus Niyogibacteria bacterium CG10_big_fil_rev_8_21_14_0_10_46_36]|uniref:Uncharacterized protein n=1 Tax=Candidatus Niyogibacteria bacterium CG10_big_fil_rev_8_21_14_0_10_46_36 TaxID=1974726 RepID=A0A2H0TDG5_9BACT|nr:MAG: hypothetical protein COU47_02525 [Candidatus Niyogibacteria bacterium CG10_big_fil_rev_8_21_14_0_10_46_36]